MHDIIRRRVMEMMEGREPAHDFQHIMRVYRNAKQIGQCEGANMEILLLSALLHDIVVYPKGSAKSSKSSDDSADLAEHILQRYNYPNDKISSISYCIRMHSHSKRLVPASLEGKILQDADRLDALGAIGIGRAFSVGGLERRSLYNSDDPFCKSGRKLDDKEWTLDHFYVKLMKLGDLMHTKSAKKIANKRTKFMMLFIRQLETEI